MAEFDSKRATEQARAKLDVRRILEQRGSGPRGPGETWKKFTCPFCGNRAAEVTKRGGSVERFKCYHQPCPAENQSLDEAGLYGQFLGTSRDDG